jgi:SET domain-containing protein
MQYFRIPGSIMHRYAMPGIPDTEHSTQLSGYGSFYNHQPDPTLANVMWRYVGGRLMVFEAMRTIEPGHEITFDYGEDTGF